ncbi:glycosyltransferase family 2 protein [Pseudoruegeria sp. SHC-113]|uniref:glycosyltransferase family 2 protein n=1 Tax=Pseudoruegeria sp. SHC-113 TaxID=2855439 RepID=UPI0021BB92F2|nr:glycosyltransferase family 2 protein [Pseudoruegeria sp. SHC-113]MCT8158635.1 glycosyltransferase family 2 protein [Pseudoruegeria sp. SHC-113]
MTRKTISVVIPTCNRPDLLVEAVQSAVAQTLPVHEIIVVDDASDMDMQPALETFGDIVRYERLAQKGGANVARNRGIALASGELIAFLDDDDIWLPDKLELQSAALVPPYEACLCTSREVSAAERPPKGWQDVREAHLKFRTPCGTSGLLATARVLEEEKFDPAIPRGQDWDLFVRLVQRHPLAFVDRSLYLRQTGHERITTTALELSPEDLLARAAAVEKHRTWLGEDAYRQRMAANLLAFISQRQGKLRYIRASLKHAGYRATVGHFTKTLRKKSQQGVYATQARRT